ncbi:MAG: hypothetical protein ABI414_06800, partial [Devosia sp.]
MAEKSARPGKAEFSIDEFFSEIEKAEDMSANKRLPQERLRNKRAMDMAARKVAEDEASAREAAAKAEAKAERAKTALEKRRTTKSNHDSVTGMAPKTGKTKINSVDRIDFDGMGESPQAGFGHVPSPENRPTTLASAISSARSKSGSSRTVEDAQTVGVTATVKALEQIILHGRKEVEGSSPWMPHRPTRPSRGASMPFRMVTPY